MLDKISNITTNIKYDEKRKGGNFSLAFLEKGELSKNQKDSIVFSPAALFLSKLGWHFRSIDLKKDILFLDFELDGFQFITEFNLKKFEIHQVQNYKIIKQESKSLSSLLVKSFIQPLEKRERISRLIGVEKYFDKISSLNLNGELAQNDSIIVSEIISEFKEEIEDDMIQINYILEQFILKLLNDKKVDFKLKDEVDNPIVIDKIVSFEYGK